MLGVLCKAFALVLIGALSAKFFPGNYVFIATTVILLAGFALFYRSLESSYQWFERRFLSTFENKSEETTAPSALHHLAPWDAHLVRMEIHPNADAYGNKHMWDTWNDANFTFFRKYSPRFASEFGHQAPPNYSTLARAIPADKRDEIRAGLDLRLPFLDFAPIHFISALHGTGVGELMRAVKHAYDASMREMPIAISQRILCHP